MLTLPVPRLLSAWSNAGFLWSPEPYWTRTITIPLKKPLE